MDIVSLWQPVIRLAVRQTARNLRSTEREDLEQECFLALLEKQEVVSEVFSRSPKEGEKFAYKLCRDKIVDIFRAARHLTDCMPFNVEMPPDNGGHDTARTPDSVLEKSIAEYNQRRSPLERTFGVTEEALDKAVDLLPSEESQVIREFFFHGSTERQIAAASGHSEWWVRQTKKRAVAHLRGLLDGEV